MDKSFTLNYYLSHVVDYSSYNSWKHSLINNVINNNVISNAYIPFNDLIANFKVILDRMENTPQSLNYHPEYNVLKHTYYVSRAAKEYSKDNREKGILLCVALLHDIGKINTTTIGKNKIWHYNHAKESCRLLSKSYLKYMISNYNLVYNLILHHMDYNDPSKIKDNDLLRNFVIFDKLISKSIYIKEDPFYFDRLKNKFTSAMMFSGRKFLNKKIYVTIGISGSGKSTYLRNHFNEENIVCPDQIRKELCGNISDQSKNKLVWSVTQERLLKKLQCFNHVVLDATNVDKSLRIQFMSKFNHCKKIALVFSDSQHISTCDERIKDELSKYVERSNVPISVLQKQHNKFIKGYSSIRNEFDKIVYI